MSPNNWMFSVFLFLLVSFMTLAIKPNNREFRQIYKEYIKNGL